MNTLPKLAQHYKAGYWSARDLVSIGVFAAAAKLSSLLIALAGGGMNPLGLILKNAVYTTLMMVLMAKVRKPGSLFLFTAIGLFVSTAVLGGSLTLLPGALVGGLLGELAGLPRTGFTTTSRIILGAFIYDVTAKGVSLGISYLFLRESPTLMDVVVPIVGIGYLGCLLGLFLGWRMLGELRHAGFIR